MEISNEVLKQILIKSGFVTSKEFDDAALSAEYLDKDVKDVLVFRGLISEEAIAKHISNYLKVPFVDIGKLVVPDEILNIIPEQLARSYRIVAFAKKDNQLSLAMENPKNFEALEFSRRKTGLAVAPFYSSKESIIKGLSQYKRNFRTDFNKIITENIKRASTGDDPQTEAEKLPVIKVLDTTVTYAVAERASDVHIETLEKEVIIRFRIDGVLKDIIKLPRGIQAALVARVKILSNLKIDEHRVPQDGRYKFKVDEEAIGLRVSIIPSFYGENVVMRLLPETTRPFSLEELGITGYNLKILSAAINRPYGMVLVTGPTGSGKTTTLYSVLNILNTSNVKIATIEDPIEYGIKRITQIQVNPKSGLNFATGLRALLRHDPDIIMVGEIRDKETADIAVHSAMTGHLVLSTLHTNTATGALPRFMDMGIEGYLLASTINVVMAQRLVRKICKACLTEYTPNKDILARLSKETGTDLLKQKYYKGAGCDDCHRSGYQGRIGIYEGLEVTEKMRSLITQKSSSDVLQKQAVSEGMVTMLQDGLDKIASGLTTIDEVLKAIRES